MKDKIVNSLEPITLIGGGAIGPTDVKEALALAPVCVAADGGARHALDHGAPLRAVIGDMDSLSQFDRSRVPADALHHISEQDSTDFDKALRSIQAPLIIAVGFMGGRVDHQLASLHSLVARNDTPCVLMAETEIVMHCQTRVTLPTQPGDCVSLFPLGPVSGSSDGLEWEIDGLQFDPRRKIGTSNCAKGPVTLEFDEPGMVVILPRRLIQPVADLLLN